MRPMLALLAVVAGCFSVEYPDGVIVCGQAGCPPGYQCATDGTCRRAPLGDDAGTDAADPGDAGTDAGGDAAPSLACSSVRMLADDFDDGVRGGQWQWSYGATLEQDGMANFPLMAATWSAYDATYEYDLTGAAFEIRVVEVAAVPDAYTYLGLGHDIEGPDPVARVIYLDGQIYAESKNGGVIEVVGEPLTYDPDQHRWWRIRESGGTLFWEVSPDGLAWTELGSRALWFDPGYVRPHFGLGTDLADPGAGTARFDDFNGGVAAGQACATSTVSDDFADPAISDAHLHRWASGTCIATYSAGAATVALSGSGAGDCTWASRRGLDLRGDQVSVRIDLATTVEGVYSYLGVETLAGDEVYISAIDGTLYVTTRIDGVVNDLVQIPYAPNLHRYWRLRETDGLLYADLSAGGLNWASTEIGTPFALHDLRAWIGAGVGGQSGSAVVRFDDLNILP